MGILLQLVRLGVYYPCPDGYNESQSRLGKTLFPSLQDDSIQHQFVLFIEVSSPPPGNPSLFCVRMLFLWYSVCAAILVLFFLESLELHQPPLRSGSHSTDTLQH